MNGAKWVGSRCSRKSSSAFQRWLCCRDMRTSNVRSASPGPAPRSSPGSIPCANFRSGRPGNTWISLCGKDSRALRRAWVRVRSADLWSRHPLLRQIYIHRIHEHQPKCRDDDNAVAAGNPFPPRNSPDHEPFASYRSPKRAMSRVDNFTGYAGKSASGLCS